MIKNLEKYASITHNAFDEFLGTVPVQCCVIFFYRSIFCLALTCFFDSVHCATGRKCCYD